MIVSTETPSVCCEIGTEFVCFSRDGMLKGSAFSKGVGRKNIVLLDGVQASPARPSDAAEI